MSCFGMATQFQVNFPNVQTVGLGWQLRTEMIKFKIRFGGGSIVARVVFKHTKSFFYPNYNI